MERNPHKRKTEMGQQELGKDKDVSGRVASVGVSETVNNNEADKSGSDLKRLLEDLQLSRKCIEEDQRAYQKAIRDIQDVDKMIVTLRKESLEFNQRKEELAKAIAVKGTELKCAEFQFKVATDAKKTIQQELILALGELHKARMEVNTLSTNFLSGVLQFGTICNGTTEGYTNRVQAELMEKERLEHEKTQLETELEDFLALQKGLAESEKQLHELEIQHKEQDEEYNLKEKKLEDRFNELDFELAELKHQEESDTREFQMESDALKNQIEKLQNRITCLESQSANTKQTMVCQKENSKDVDTDIQTISDPSNNIASNVDCITLDSSIKTKIQRKPEIKKQPVVSRSNNNLKVPSQFSRNAKGTFKCPLLNSNSDDMFSDSCEDEMLLAAADEISQNIRTYEPMAPSKTFSQRYPSAAPSQGPTTTQPSKRINNGQVPITSFMRQLSTPLKKPRNTKNIHSSRGKNVSTLSQVSSTPRDSTGPSKVFNFKKKTSAAVVEVENLSMDFDPSASVIESSFPTDSFECNMMQAESEIDGLDENPNSFSIFQSARLLLNESERR